MDFNQENVLLAMQLFEDAGEASKANYDYDSDTTSRLVANGPEQKLSPVKHNRES